AAGDGRSRRHDRGRSPGPGRRRGHRPGEGVGRHEPDHLPRTGPTARGRRPACRAGAIEYRALGRSGRPATRPPGRVLCRLVPRSRPGTNATPRPRPGARLALTSPGPTPCDRTSPGPSAPNLPPRTTTNTPFRPPRRSAEFNGCGVLPNLSGRTPRSLTSASTTAGPGDGG